MIVTREILMNLEEGELEKLLETCDPDTQDLLYLLLNDLLPAREVHISDDLTPESMKQ